MACTTEGSANVEVSPRSSTSPAATLRRIRRIILPDRVLGRPGVICKGGVEATDEPVKQGFTLDHIICTTLHSTPCSHQEPLWYSKGADPLSDQPPQPVPNQLFGVLHTISEDHKRIDSFMGGPGEKEGEGGGKGL